MTQRLQVIVESESAEAERAAVADVFEVVGIPADVRGAYIRESAGDVLPWLIQIETTVKDLFGLGPAGAAGAVGADGWTGIKDLVRHLYEARKGKDGGVTLRDPETRTEIRLPPDLPDEAYQRLAEIEHPRSQQSGHLRVGFRAPGVDRPPGRPVRLPLPGLRGAGKRRPCSPGQPVGHGTPGILRPHASR
jgi:hypothetical protein